MRSQESKVDSNKPNPSAETGLGSELPTPHSSLLTSSELPTPHSSLPSHTIRLGPPWRITSTDGGTRHSRKFGRPRTLDANEQLWLVCELVPGSAEVHVNGVLVETLDAASPFAADITALLQPRNEVTLTVRSDAALGAVQLEVRTG